MTCGLVLGCRHVAGKAIPFRSGVNIGMKIRIALVVIIGALVSHSPFSIVSGQENPAPVVVGEATEIPGVVEGGSEIHHILEGYNGLDDPIGLADGSLVFAGGGVRRSTARRYASPVGESRSARSSTVVLA